MIDVRKLENSCGSDVCAYRGKGRGVCSFREGAYCPMYTAYKPVFFQEKEFQRCTPACSMKDMHPAFLKVLDAIRDKAGIPIVLNCAYRSKSYDQQKGRSGKSAHCYGMAVDIRCNTSANRNKIIRAAYECGVTRIGVATTFIHVDIGENVGLPANVTWTYDANGNAV